MIDYVAELRKAYNGNAWHGNNASHIISEVVAHQYFAHPIPNAHSIAEIVLHLTSWTDEVASRLTGNLPADPIAGDWPFPKEETSAEWNNIVSDFHLANERLINLIIFFSVDDWNLSVKGSSSESIKYSELLNGLLQHHAYHAGQISLLSKFK
ncbi:MAG: DinB family protein [Bacteroidota bacterium]